MVLVALVGPPLAGAAAADRDSGRDTPDGPWLVWGTGRPDVGGTQGAYTYDTSLVPEGATVSLGSVSLAGHTRTALTVRGLKPGHRYGTHLHVGRCGSDPSAAGPHYQQQTGDPGDPDVANARNEVWLDVRAGLRGTGAAVAHNRWTYRAAPGSVVLHAGATSTDPDTPGRAGARVACVTLSSW
jgi:Cu-Zn family superoxide dismutase